MRRITLTVALVVIVAGIVVGGFFLWDQLTRVSTERLAQVVQRDGIPFEPGSIPPEVIDRLASNQVVIVGEFHFLREHRELIADLVRELHARGFRQYLFEWTQAADWLLSDYVNDAGLMPDWSPPHDIGGAAIRAIRDLNRTLPVDDRIRVHGIDVTLQDYGGAATFLASLELLALQLANPGPIVPFLQGEHGTEEQHRARLEILQAELQAQQAMLVLC